MIAILAAMALAVAAPADLVIQNARIYTGDPAQPHAKALAVRGTRLAYVGADAKAYVGKRTKVVDLEGAFLMPAFHDTHVHPIDAGVEMGQCDLNGTASAAEVVARVNAYRKRHPGKTWIVGTGWNLTLFPGGNPRREVLDAAVSDRPMLLWSSDGHSAWLNSLALRKAGITRDSKDPPAGRIERDPVTGAPSGTLRESAVDLALRLLPPVTGAEYRRGLARAQGILARHGIVSIQEASADENELATYARAARQGTLEVRVRAAQSFDEIERPTDAERIAVLKTYRDRYKGPGFAAGAVKLFVDGVIEARTAALLAPYLLDGKPATGDDALGKPSYAPARLTDIVTRLDAAGFQVHMHAIGDGAVRMGLDAIEAAAGRHGIRDRRPVLAHLELIDAADLPRFRKLGALPCIQPFWAYPDEYVKNLTAPVIGPERTARLYPTASLQRAGARLAGGSDWSVTTDNPLEAIEVAVTRQAPDKPSSEVLGAAERLTLAQALAAYTSGGAYANFEENASGTVSKGKWADFIVLDTDPFAVSADKIGEIKVRWTVREGKTTWRAPR